MADFNRLPKPSLLQEHRRRQVEDGYVFPLEATSLGGDELWHIRVRDISLMNSANIKMLPTATQDVVYAGLKELERTTKVAQSLPEATNLFEMAKNNEMILQAADRFFCAVAVEPQVVLTQAEVADEDTYYVDQIAPEDRVTLFFATMNKESEQAKKLKLFRPGPKADVRPVPAGGLVELAPERADGVEGGGV